jgi:DNA-binding beta-propeller fold protein YncE
MITAGCCLVLEAQQTKSGYSLIKKVPIGGNGSWDYMMMDSDARRLYISHENQVVVFDPDSQKVVANIANTDGVHGIALVKELNKGFISDGRANQVTIFDLKTLKEIGTVKSTGENPDCIIYDPASKRIFTFNGRSGTATAIDAQTGTVAGTVDLGGGKPEFSAVDGKGNLWVNVEDKSSVVWVDTQNLKAKAHWPLGDCQEPASMALDREDRRLFVGCRNKLLALVDADSGHVLQTAPVGAGVDANAYDPASHLVFSSARDGTLSIFHVDSPDHITPVDVVKTSSGAGTLALDRKTGNIYLVTADLKPAPPPTAAQPRPRPVIVPDTFRVLVVGKSQ